MLDSVADVASAIYVAPHLLLRFAAFYLVGTQLFHKPRQIVFAAVSVSGIGHALEKSVFGWPVLAVITLDAITLCGIILLLVNRHHALTKLHPSTTKLANPSSLSSSSADRSPPEHYTLFVIGSGGHTAEMLSMIERSIRPLNPLVSGTSTSPDSTAPRMIRRYVVSHGDTMSVRKVHALEARIAARFAALTGGGGGGGDSAIGADPGVYDIKLVTRARRVHQSWLSTPASFARSILSIFGALCARPPLAVSSPSSQAGPGNSPIQATRAHYPGVIATNGPGTAFAVVLVSHVLRMLCLVPQTHMHVVYVESFAKVSTLSLTGKLLYALDLADQFIVQWPRLHERYPRSLLCPYFSVRPAEWIVPEVAEGDVVGGGGRGKVIQDYGRDRERVYVER